MNIISYDVVAVGELLADFIGTAFSESLYDAQSFVKYQGGSPSNFATNLANLGRKTAVIASVGDDSIGRFLIDEIKPTGVDVSMIQIHHSEPTSVVIVSKTTKTPDFVAYRMADKELLNIDQNFSAKIIHTTCFALSKNPAQTTILEIAKKHKAKGSKLSIDLNYSDKIWPNRTEAIAVIKDFVAQNALVKISEDDAFRIFGEHKPDDFVIETLKGWGADIVCFTKGASGGLVWENATDQTEHFGVEKVEVKDVTGAGDAFWAGFLSAYMDHNSIKGCITAGNKMAAIKLSTVGPVKRKIQRSELVG